MDRPGLGNLRQEVEKARAHNVDRDPAGLIQWAHGLLGNELMMSTAFGKGGMCLLHMVRDIAPEMPIYFVDTGFHFSETMEYVDTLRERWGINLLLKRPKLHGDDFKKTYGANLYQTDPDLCCHKNKVEPFEEILQEYGGWITAVRRDQGATRAQAETLEVLEGGKLKVQPLVYWKRQDVEDYVREKEIPLHPLFSQGYASIGCAPCTRPVVDGADERSGRWVGLAKRECGLHTRWGSKVEEDKPETEAPAPSDAAPGTGTGRKIDAGPQIDTGGGVDASVTPG